MSARAIPAKWAFEGDGERVDTLLKQTERAWQRGNQSISIPPEVVLALEECRQQRIAALEAALRERSQERHNIEELRASADGHRSYIPWTKCTWPNCEKDRALLKPEMADDPA